MHYAGIPYCLFYLSDLFSIGNLKIAQDLGVRPRAVNDRVPEAGGLHFIDRKRITDDVLG